MADALHPRGGLRAWVGLLVLTLLLSASSPVARAEPVGVPPAGAVPGAVVAWGDNNWGQTDVPPAALAGVVAVAGGGSHSMALRADGSVVVWGSKILGNQDVPLAAQSDVVAIAAGTVFSLALRRDGSVVAWGDSGLAGPAVPPSAQAHVKAISAGDFYALALKDDGSVVAWGRPDHGEGAVPVAAQSGVTAIAAGADHALALKSDGSVVAWGDNRLGPLDVPAAASSGVVAIAAGYQSSVALKADGAVVAWGDTGWLDGDHPPGAGSGITAIDLDLWNFVARRSDGTIYARSNSISRATEVPESARAGVTAVAAGAGFDLVVVSPAPRFTADDPPAEATAGEEYSYTFAAFGIPPPTFRVSAGALPPGLSLDSSGVLRGTPTTTGRFDFTIQADNGVAQTDSAQTISVVAGREREAAATGGGSQAAASGALFAEPLEVRVTDYLRNPVPDVEVTFRLPATTSGSAAFAGGAQTVSVRTDETGQARTPAVRAGRAGATTALATIAGGTGATYALTILAGEDAEPPAQRRPDPGAASPPPDRERPSPRTKAKRAVQTSAALVGPGGVFGWGDNTRKQLDVPPAAQSGVVAVSAGNEHALALRTDGSVVAWGSNLSGQTDVPVAARSDVTAIAAGSIHSLALRRDGSVVAWGSNDWGQTDVPAAAQSGVVAIDAGGAHSLALTAQGEIVAWGNNFYGQAQPPSGGGFIAVAAGASHSAALRSDGSLVTWGDDRPLQTYQPTEAEPRIRAIAAGGDYTLAVRADGSVLSFVLGVLQTSPELPASVSSGVAAVAVGGRQRLALKTDGAVIAWLVSNGDGYVDELGIGKVPDVVSGAGGAGAIAAGAQFNLVVIDPAPRFTASDPPATATAGTRYSYTFVGFGVPLPTFAVSAGALPPGLGLDEHGVLSGTPVQAGRFTFTVRASNGAGSGAESTRTITVGPTTPQLALATSAGGQVAVPGQVLPDPLEALVTDRFGNPVSGVPVTFTLPTGASGSATFSGNALQVQADTDAAGVARSPAVTAGRSGAVTALASIVGGSSATYALTIAAPDSAGAVADTGVRATASAPRKRRGTIVTVRVTNEGPATATRLWTGVALPRGWTVRDVGDGTVHDRTVVFERASLAVGETVTYRLRLVPRHSGRSTLAVSTFSGEPDSDPSNNLIGRRVHVR